LVETLVGLLILSFIVLFSLEIFGMSRSLFFKLKAAEEESQAALSALDKARIDILHAGLGLLQPMRLGLIDGLSGENGVLSTQCQEKAYLLAEDVSSGQTEIQLLETEGLASGREICLFDQTNGELKTVSRVEGATVSFSSPLTSSFLQAEASLVLLERTSIYFDQSRGMIRRKVNLSPPQPLLEDVAGFDFSYVKDTNLVTLNLWLTANKEKNYERAVYPKNTGLALQK